MSQDRATFQQLAELRLAEARSLLENGFSSGAYYLAGYAVECALKAVIAADFRANEIPDLRYVRDIYTHDIEKLLKLAGLETELKENPGLLEDWAIIAKWSEAARYEVWTQESASSIVDAVGGDEGLLRWLQNR